MKVHQAILTFLLIFIFKSAFPQGFQNPPSEYRIAAIKTNNPDIVSVSNEIKLYLPMKIYLPTAFTPNGDGLNDTFGAVGEGIEAYQLRIYNRWGEIIFQAKSIKEKWSGLQNGKPVPQGEYSYELLAYGKEFGEIHTSGSVMVIN